MFIPASGNKNSRSLEFFVPKCALHKERLNLFKLSRNQYIDHHTLTKGNLAHTQARHGRVDPLVYCCQVFLDTIPADRNRPNLLYNLIMPFPAMGAHSKYQDPSTLGIRKRSNIGCQLDLPLILIFLHLIRSRFYFQPYILTHANKTFNLTNLNHLLGDFWRSNTYLMKVNLLLN